MTKVIKRRRGGERQFPPGYSGTGSVVVVLYPSLLLALQRRHRQPGRAIALQASGHRVLDVNRADRRARRRHGKNDPLDAEAAARAVLSGQATTLAKSGTSSVEMVRHLKLARDSAVKARAQAMQMLKALIVSAPAELREQLEGIRGKMTLVRHLAALRAGQCLRPHGHRPPARRR